MKIINNLNKSTLISKIKYPFIKIASLFERVFASNRIQIIENPKYLSAENMFRSSKDSNSKTEENSIVDIAYENEYQDIDQYNGKIPLQSTVQHLYTRINKTGNGKIDRYLPSDQKVDTEQNTEVVKPKNGLAHPFLTEMVAPPIPPKNSLLIEEITKKNLSLKSLLAGDYRPLTILKEFELFI